MIRVATGGCFDLFHIGHLDILRRSRALGDHLTVLLNSDDSVARLKGPGRPIIPAWQRREILLALNCVDKVVFFAEDTPCEALGTLKPDIWVKGGDRTMDQLPEAKIVQSYGGRVEILPFTIDQSTSKIISKILQNPA